jgi:crotonobetainyl-CoA:carnitine CoA-transferase CaiB-like acyl-CoA transferase
LRRCAHRVLPDAETVKSDFSLCFPRRIRPFGCGAFFVPEAPEKLWQHSTKMHVRRGKRIVRNTGNKRRNNRYNIDKASDPFHFNKLKTVAISEKICINKEAISMRKPLEGLFVVEMTSYWSATTTARFLRDMGARVVRVETPPIGDFCRYYGRSMGMPITAEENPIHDIFNGGKECVALDLKDPKNLKLMQNMLAKADVFITSTRTAGLKKLGLDWETLHAKYPKLVMGQVTGYGINGPLVNRPGIDAIAYFGANGVILDTRTDPDSPPIYPPAGMGDTTTGITLLSGVLAALLAARETGVGDYVMTSLYGTGNFVTAGFATNCNYGYEWPREAHTMSPLGQGYKCRDGRYIYVFVNDYTSVWPKFAKALRLPEEVVTDPRFTTKESTTIIANRSALVDIIREYALQRDAQDILDELVAYDVPSCILNQYKDRFSGEWLEQSVSNGYLIEHTYPSGNKAYLAQMPIYFDSLGVQDLYAQHRALGADNEAIEKEFGDGE